CSLRILGLLRDYNPLAFSACQESGSFSGNCMGRHGRQEGERSPFRPVTISTAAVWKLAASDERSTKMGIDAVLQATADVEINEADVAGFAAKLEAWCETLPSGEQA